MKKQNGVTLISLTIYVISLTIIITILATISGFFYKNMNDVEVEISPLTELTNFNSYFTGEIEKNNIRVKYCTSEYIIFMDNNTSEDIRYVYVEHDKAIYRDNGEEGEENKATFKIARGVENCTFLEEIENGKSKITVHLTIGDKNQSYTYILNR